MTNDHKRKVVELAGKVREFYHRGVGFKVYHGNTNSTRVLEFDRARMVDTSGFDQVMQVDMERRVALVEANVPMDKLVRATLAHGLVAPVVMEFPGITVAGGLQGGAGESSSFKWGGFDKTLNWFEMVLANGEVVRASADERSDLFFGTAGSYGTLGVVTAAEVQLIPARRYVELEYVPVHGFDEAVNVIREQTAGAPDFVDGVMFGRDLGVIMVGRMTDRADRPVLRLSRAGDEWFYLHVRGLLQSARLEPEVIPLAQYLFRYDRGAFWMGKYAFERFGQPFNKVTRRMLDPVMHTRQMYEALQASGVSQEFVIQDLAMPAMQAVELLDYVDQEFNMYPLWLCPLKIDDPDGRSPLLSRPLADGQAINVGVWGFVSRDLDRVVAANRRLEAKVTELGGRKWLYAYAYYTQQEFWELYDQQWYEALRKKYHAETLPTIYDKVCRAPRYKVSAKRGAAMALLGRRGIRMSK